MKNDTMFWINLTILSTFFYSCSSRIGFGGVNLRFTAYHGPPYNVLIRDQDGNYTHVGSNAEAFDWLARRLNFSITLVPIIDEAIIARIGIYDAAFSKVISKEVEGILSSHVITPLRAELMDYTCGLWWSEPYNLVVPTTEYESRLFAFIRPFQPTVWLLLGLSLTIFVGVMSYFSWIYCHQSSKLEKTLKENETTSSPSFFYRIGYYLMYVICILTNHGAYTSYSYYSFRILAGCWLLAAFILVNSYSGLVMSALTVPTRESPVNSLEDLAVMKNNVSMIMHRTVVLTQIIKDAKSGIYLGLGNQLRNHPERLFIDFTLGYKKLEEGFYALPWLSSSNAFFIAAQYRKNGRKCHFRLSDPLHLTYFTSFVSLQKHSKYTSGMNSAVIELWETGLMRYWINNLLLPGADKCFDNKPPKSTTSVPINLVDLSSAFLIFGIGVGLSLLSFVIEISFSKLHLFFFKKFEN